MTYFSAVHYTVMVCGKDNGIYELQSVRGHHPFAGIFRKSGKQKHATEPIPLSEDGAFPSHRRTNIQRPYHPSPLLSASIRRINQHIPFHLSNHWQSVYTRYQSATGDSEKNQSNRMTADNIFLGSRHVHAKCFHSVPTYAKQPSDIHSSFLPTGNGKLLVSKKDDPSCQTVRFFFHPPSSGILFANSPIPLPSTGKGRRPSLKL